MSGPSQNINIATRLYVGQTCGPNLFQVRVYYTGSQYIAGCYFETCKNPCKIYCLNFHYCSSYYRVDVDQVHLQARPRLPSSWLMQCPTHSLPRVCVGLDAEKMAGLMVASNSFAACCPSASYPRLQLYLYALLTLPSSSQTPPSPSPNQKPSSPRVLQSRQTTETSTPLAAGSAHGHLGWA